MGGPPAWHRPFRPGLSKGSFSSGALHSIGAAIGHMEGRSAARGARIGAKAGARFATAAMRRRPGMTIGDQAHAYTEATEAGARLGHKVGRMAPRIGAGAAAGGVLAAGYAAGHRRSGKAAE